jgi:hypothetical protein
VQVPTQRAQQYVQAELERFQESLSRCVLQCQDDVKDKVSQQSHNIHGQEQKFNVKKTTFP